VADFTVDTADLGSLSAVFGAAGFDATGIADPLVVTLRRGRDRVQVDIGSDGTIQIRR